MLAMLSAPRLTFWLSLFLILLLPTLSKPAVGSSDVPPVSGRISIAEGIEQWDDQFGLPGVGGTVRAIAVSGDDIYVGGEFLQAAGLPSSSILRWDGRRWHDLGGGVRYSSGVPGRVNAIAVIGSQLFVGGSFIQAGAIPANNIAVWDGTAWAALETGVQRDDSAEGATVNALAVHDNDLFVGGVFDTAGGEPVTSFARWEPASGAWSAAGSGLVGDIISPLASIHALAAAPDGLYVGGYFDEAGGETVNSIAFWNQDAESWSPVGGGVTESEMTNGTVMALALDGDNLYVGGRFTAAGGQGAEHIARWNRASGSWSSLGSGVGEADEGEYPVQALAVLGSRLYAGGEFTRAGNVTANHIAYWEAGSWHAVVDGSANGTSAGILTLASRGDKLYAGGSFITAGAVEANYIARWSDSDWHALGHGAGAASVEALAVNRSGEIYAGGLFQYIGGVAASNIARWDGSAWQPLGDGTDGMVTALAMVEDDLFVGGHFLEAGGQIVHYIARWNETTRAWDSLGSGTGFNVEALAVKGNIVYAGGDFATAGGIVTSGVAMWNRVTQQWSPLGTRASLDAGRVSAIATRGDLVFLGGSFDFLHGESGQSVAVNRIAVWDSVTDEWYALSEAGRTGVGGGHVYALKIMDNTLYVGGNFATAGPIASSGVAGWDLDTGRWLGLDGGVEGSFHWVEALVGDGTYLYAGGDFLQAGGETVNNIARWNTVADEWETMNSGVSESFMNAVDPTVQALAASAGDVYAGGVFLRAGDTASSNFARWRARLPEATSPLSAAGGSLTSTDISIQFPAGAVDEPLTLSYLAYPNLPHPPNDDESGLRSWSVEARAASGRIISSFEAAYTMIISYSDSDLAAQHIAESSLTVAYWNGSDWVAMLPCAGCGINTDTNRVTILADHLTTFALLGESEPPLTDNQQLYLPFIRR